jgi:hypothetical protein
MWGDEESLVGDFHLLVGSFESSFGVFVVFELDKTTSLLILVHVGRDNVSELLEEVFKLFHLIIMR